jgi:general secretion pathway protein K
MAFISSLFATVLHVSTSSGRAAAVFANAMRADELGRAAVDLVEAEVASDDQGAKRGGAFTASFGDSKVMVNYVTEAARVDVNLAPPELFAALFEAAGLDPSQAATLAGNIKESRKSQQTAQTAPGQAGPGQAGQGQPGAQGAQSTQQQQPQPGAQTAPAAQNGQIQFDHIDLIASAWGLPAQVFAAVSPILSVANGTATIDPTLANRLVIAALMGADDQRVDDFLERRRRGFDTEEQILGSFPPNVKSFIGFSDAHAYRVVADVQIGNRFERKYEFVIAAPDKTGKGTKTISWRILPSAR